MFQRKKFLTRKQFHKMLDFVFEKNLYFVEFKDNTSKIVNGHDFLELDANNIKSFKLI